MRYCRARGWGRDAQRDYVQIGPTNERALPRQFRTSESPLEPYAVRNRDSSQVLHNLLKFFCLPRSVLKARSLDSESASPFDCTITRWREGALVFTIGAAPNYAVLGQVQAGEIRALRQSARSLTSNATTKKVLPRVRRSALFWFIVADGEPRYFLLDPRQRPGVLKRQYEKEVYGSLQRCNQAEWHDSRAL